MSNFEALTISVIIPAYNEEHHIGACLDALMGQLQPSDEVIVVNNNSSDKTVEIAGSYSAVRVLHETTQGIVYARNKGFDAARGDIIARIDADTNVSDGWLQHIRATASDIPVTDGVSGPCTFRGTPVPAVTYGFHRVVYFWSSWLLFGHRILFGSNMFIYRQTWEKVRKDACLTNTIHEDMDLSHHIVAHGGRIHFDNKLRASISSRRFGNWYHYPKMWLGSRLIHVSWLSRDSKR